MARSKRIFIAGQVYFALQEGNSGSRCFYDDACYRHYLLRLLNSLVYFQVKLHAYALLPNEIQLLLTPATPEGISRLMQRLGGAYAQYFNSRFERSGSLWKGRFKSSVVQGSRQLCSCQKFIELAPVQTGLADKPGQHEWSSYCANAFGDSRKVLAAHEQFKLPGQNPANRFRLYREYIASGFSSEQYKALEYRLRHGHPLIDGDAGLKRSRIIKKCRYNIIQSGKPAAVNQRFPRSLIKIETRDGR